MFGGETISIGTLLLFLLVPVLLMFGLFAAMPFVLRRAGLEPVDERGVGEGHETRRAGRPWWSNPMVWLAVGAVMLFIGLFVTPRLLGGVFLFLPFMWMGGRRRTFVLAPRCPTCGERLGPEMTSCPRCGSPVR